jgi:hypothetical protein
VPGSVLVQRHLPEQIHHIHTQHPRHPHQRCHRQVHLPCFHLLPVPPVDVATLSRHFQRQPLRLPQRSHLVLQPLPQSPLLCFHNRCWLEKLRRVEAHGGLPLLGLGGRCSGPASLRTVGLGHRTPYKGIFGPAATSPVATWKATPDSTLALFLPRRVRCANGAWAGGGRPPPGLCPRDQRRVGSVVEHFCTRPRPR